MIESMSGDWGVWQGLIGSGRVGSFASGGVRRADGSPETGEVCIREAGGSFNTPIIDIVLAADGVWEVKGLDINKLYRAEIKDKGRELNGAVLDWLQPVPM